LAFGAVFVEAFAAAFVSPARLVFFSVSLKRSSSARGDASLLRPGRPRQDPLLTQEW